MSSDSTYYVLDRKEGIMPDPNNPGFCMHGKPIAPFQQMADCELCLMARREEMKPEMDALNAKLNRLSGEVLAINNKTVALLADSVEELLDRAFHTDCGDCGGGDDWCWTCKDIMWRAEHALAQAGRGHEPAASTKSGGSGTGINDDLLLFIHVVVDRFRGTGDPLELLGRAAIMKAQQMIDRTSKKVGGTA